MVIFTKVKMMTQKKETKNKTRAPRHDAKKDFTRMKMETTPSPLERRKAELTLTYVVLEGNASAALSLIMRGASANATNDQGFPLLVIAVGNHDREMVEMLIRHRADVNAKTASGYTALMHAAAVGDLELARMLLENGADPKMRDNEGRTAKDRALKNNFREIAALLGNGSNSSKKKPATHGRRFINSSFFLAAGKGETKEMAELLRKGAQIEAKNGSGKTALIWAAINGQDSAIQMLLDKGAKINERDSSGYTATKWAKVFGKQNTAELLKSKGGEE